MSIPDSSDSRRVLYLEQIDIEAAKTGNMRFRLQKDSDEVQIQQKAGTWTWIPSRTLELFDVSEIKISARHKHSLFGKFEMLAAVTGKDAMEAFWDSNESISRHATIDKQPVTITFHYRPSHTCETMRVAIEEVKTSMKDYKALMKQSTEQRINAVIKLGTVIVEMDLFSKLGFGIAKGIFDILKEQRKYDENVSDLASGIAALLPFANRAVEDILYKEGVLEGVVRRLYDLVGDTANFVIGYAKRGPAIRALSSTISPEDHDTIEALHADLGRLKDDFDRAVNVEALNGVRRIEESRLLKRLKPIEAANYDEYHSCMEGTRTTILEEIASWATKSFNNETKLNDFYTKVFWLYGMPGLGKTSVATSLCDRLERDGNLGGSFFCKHDSEELREPRRVLPTLIAMLARMWGPFRKLVAEALVDGKLINPQSTNGELLLKPLQLLKMHPTHPLVLVIDALDECGQPSTRGPLLRSLAEACSLVGWLKVVVTSRPEPDIKSFFDRNHVVNRDLATDDLKGKDIRLFAERRMASIARRRHLSPDLPSAERVGQIVERSRGLFMFVDTLSRLVDVPEPEPLLVQVLNGKLEDANAELHKLYSTVITSRAVGRIEGMQSMLRAVIAVSACRPLCAETLAKLIDLEVPIILSWLDELSSLLYQDAAEENGIRVRHLSVLEFLVGSACPQKFRVDQKLANSELTQYCLATMAKNLQFNICGLETAYLSNAYVPGLKDRVKRRIPDTLQYSCMHWSNHLCYDFDPVSTEITGLLDDFFVESQPLYWIEVLSLMGKVPVAISSVRLMKACFKKFEDRHQHMVEDVFRFLLAFFTPISTSTPHIYVSALPFTPTESDLWKHASISFPEIIDVCKGRRGTWPAPSNIWLGHTGAIWSLAYSPDGLSIVSGSRDNTIRIWDARTGAAVGQPLTGHTRPVWSVAYSPDGKNVVSGSDDNTIRIWDAQTGAAVGKPLTGHTQAVSSVAYSPDGRNIVSGSDDNTIQTWDAQTGVAVGRPLTGHTQAVYSVTYSPDGRNIVSGSLDSTIRIWDTQTRAAVGQPLTGHTQAVSSVAYSPDGQKVVSGSVDNTVQIWDAQTGAAVGQPLRGHTDPVRSVAYSPDGRNVVSGSEDNTIRIWDAQTGASVGQPHTAHTQAVSSVTYSPDGQNVVSDSVDNTVQIWDAQTGAVVRQPLTGHAAWVLSVAYSPDGRNVVSGSDDNTIRTWDGQTGAAVGKPLTGHNQAVYSVAYSPDGQNVISGSLDSTIRIWDAQTGAAVGQPLTGHIGAIWSVSYSSNGQNILSGSSENTVRIWDAQTGAVVGQPLAAHTRSITSVAYSPDGQNIVAGFFDGTIRIWNVQTRATVGQPLTGHTGWVCSVAYSPDGRNVVSGSDDNTIRIWDTQTGVAVGQPLTGHTRAITSVAYSPDGKNVASGSTDNTIRLWDAQTGVSVGQPLTAHTDFVRSVAYSPDGQSIVSGSDDNTIRIWDVHTGVAVGQPLTGHTGWVYSVGYSPDGQNIVSGSDDNTIRIWDAQTGAAVGQPLTGHSGAAMSIAYSATSQNVMSGSTDNTIRICDTQAGMDDASHGVISHSSHPFNDRQSLTAFSCHAIPPTRLDPDGWVRGAEGLLFWVPEDCRHGLTCPAILTIPHTGHQRPVRINFTHFHYGALWTNIRGRSPGSKS